MKPEDFARAVDDLRAFAVIRTASEESALAVSRACLEGGVRLLEVTFTTPGAASLIRRLADMEGAIAGAGSCISRDQVRAAAAAGAVFVVSPHCDPEIAAEAKGLGLAVALGGITPTELLACHRAGADIVKIFPASSFGPSYVKAVREPLPFLRLMPTGGVDAKNLAAYLDAGAVAVGMAGSLLPKDDVAAGRWSVIRDKAAEVAAAVATWKRGRA